MERVRFQWGEERMTGQALKRAKYTTISRSLFDKGRPSSYTDTGKKGNSPLRSRTSREESLKIKEMG